MVLTLRSGDFAAFFAAPFAAYGPGSPYVSPLQADLRRALDKTTNPLFAMGSDLDYFTAHRDGQVVGRITAHVHAASNHLHGLSRAYFGYFDCADDGEAAKVLLDAAEGWARARGMTQIGGNFNLTAMQQIGGLTGGFDHAPVDGQLWSPPHMARVLTDNGYTPGFGMSTFAFELTSVAHSTLGPRERAILEDPDFSFAPMSRRTLAQRTEEARQILNAACAAQLLFTPVSAAEHQFQIRSQWPILDPELSVVMHYRDRPVACMLCVPVNPPALRPGWSPRDWLAPLQALQGRRTTRHCGIKFVGVVPEMQGRGMVPVLVQRVMLALQQAGFQSCHTSWVEDGNVQAMALLNRTGANLRHRLHLFGKAL